MNVSLTSQKLERYAAHMCDSAWRYSYLSLSPNSSRSNGPALRKYSFGSLGTSLALTRAHRKYTGNDTYRTLAENSVRKMISNVRASLTSRLSGRK